MTAHTKDKANNKTATSRNRARQIHTWQAANRDLIVAMVDNPGLVQIARSAITSMK